MTADPRRFRVLPLPVFPVVSDEADGAAPPVDPFSPNELLGGFLAGPENRFAELAARLAIEGVPVFARPIGGARPTSSGSDSPFDASSLPTASRADVEILFNGVAADPSADRIDALFRPTANAASAPVPKSPSAPDAAPSLFPPIVGYRRLEDVDYLTPLVLYGPSGSGKTRLVEGICQRRRLLEPSRAQYYMSGADFFQALINAIRRDETPLFRRLFSQASVVAIENADVLAERPAAQAEFLPILDLAIKERKLVILTLSKLPNEIPGLPPELAARLGGGLLIPTRLPSRESKRFAVERIAAKFRWTLDDDALDSLAESLPSGIGGLCATLAQAAREFAATRTAPTPDALAEFLTRRNPPPTWTLERIVKTVAKYFGVSVVEMRSAKRTKTLVLARAFAVYLARKLTDATLREIGRRFSNREHSTALHAFRELESALETDATLRKNLRDLVELLRARDYVDAPEY